MNCVFVGPSCCEMFRTIFSNSASLKRRARRIRSRRPFPSQMSCALRLLQARLIPKETSSSSMLSPWLSRIIFITCGWKKYWIPLTTESQFHWRSTMPRTQAGWPLVDYCSRPFGTSLMTIVSSLVSIASSVLKRTLGANSDASILFGRLLARSL